MATPAPTPQHLPPQDTPTPPQNPLQPGGRSSLQMDMGLAVHGDWDKSQFVKSQIDNVKERINEVSIKVSTESNKLNAKFDAKVADLDTKITTLDKKVTSLEAKVVQIEGTMRQNAFNAAADVTRLETDTLPMELGKLRTSIRSDIQALDNRMKKQEENMAELKDMLEELLGKKTSSANDDSRSALAVRIQGGLRNLVADASKLVKKASKMSMRRSRSRESGPSN